MEGADCTPRVNGQMLPGFVGRRVRVVGHVTEVHPDRMQMTLTDSKVITVALDPQTQVPVGTIVEVVGVATGGETIQEHNVTNFGETFNLENYEQLVKFTHTYKDLFYE